MYKGYQPDLLTRAIAELIGAFLLAFVGSGAPVAVLLLTRSSKPLIIQNLLVVALTSGFALFAIVILLGNVSGAHINPVITFALALMGRFPWTDVLWYIGAQVIGSLMGAAAILIPYGGDAVNIAHLGAPSLSGGTGIFQGVMIMAFAEVIFAVVVFGRAIDTVAPDSASAFAEGMALSMVILVIGFATGVMLSPARIFASYFITWVDTGLMNWGIFGVVYAGGPLVGASFAALIIRYITSRQVEEPA